MGWARLALVAWCLFLAAPAAAQSLSVGVEPAEAVAPADITLHLHAEPPVNTSWRAWLVGDAGQALVGAGDRLPAERTFHVTEPGTFTVRLDRLDGNGTANATLTIHADPAATTGATGPTDTRLSADILPLLFAGVLMLALAAWLLARDRSRAINVAFAVLFVARGSADIVLALWANRGTWNLRPGQALDAVTGGLAHHLHPITSILVLFAAFTFLHTYLGQNNARLARGRGRFGAAMGLLAGLCILLYLTRPSVWWDPATSLPGGWLFFITGLYYPFYAVFALLLFGESVKQLPDDRRAGAFYSGLGFLFLPVFSGAGEFLFVDVLDYFGRVESATGVGRSSLGLGFEIGHWIAVLALAPIIVSGILLGKDARDHPERRGARLHFALYLAAVLLPLASLGFAAAVFVTGGDPLASAARALSVFNVFQGIWAIPYPVLVAYGLLRYQASSAQTSMQRQIRRFGLASLFFTVFFAVSEGVEALASDRFGTWIGLASAAGMTLVMNPVQERLKRRVVDPPAPEEETSQEVLFYREQVRKTLEDGVIGTSERKFLLNLQETMGIRAQTADRIEAELRNAMA